MPSGVRAAERFGKVSRATFPSFARVYVHAFGAHLPLEKCKNRRTGHRFLQIDEVEKQTVCLIRSVFPQSVPPGVRAAFFCHFSALGEKSSEGAFASVSLLDTVPGRI